MTKQKFLLAVAAGLLGIFVLLACQTNSGTRSDIVSAATPTPTPKPIPTQTKPTNDEAITIAAVGDIMLGSTSINDTFLPPNDGADILKEMTPILSKADITFGNLEGPMLEGGSTTKCPPNAQREYLAACG